MLVAFPTVYHSAGPRKLPDVEDLVAQNAITKRIHCGT